MLTYEAPIRDIRFVIDEWLDAQSDWRNTDAFADLDLSTVDAIIEEAARFAAGVLLPINSAGDLEGCRYENGAVSTPRGYKEAYRVFFEAGWPALSCSAEHGGQGLPFLLNAILYEMLNASCHAWTMYPGLAHGAYECLRAHGSEVLKNVYLPKLVSGEWLATMCLTESSAGSDLGLLRARADPIINGDASAYEITGNKIFISGGAHDLTDNIIHLVLARLPDAPIGSKGVSLFLVPQYFPDNGMFRPNTVRCNGIEKKMGIKGSATCSLVFEKAIGWMVGEPNRGLAAMFVMMNAARLQVALQGLGHAEIACQNATRYARQRLQLRAPTRDRKNSAGADPIIAHPAVRRLLSEQRALVEGERAMGYWIAHLLDMSEHHPTAAHRRGCAVIVSLLTPVAKILFTENGFSIASSALQVYGGYGYIHDTGIEQILRDSRIAMIYEGTNEVQAIDLILRKVIADDGAALRHLMALVSGEAAASLSTSGCQAQAKQLAQAADTLLRTSTFIITAAVSDVELPFRVAREYARALGLVVLGYVWCKASRLACAKEAVDSFYREKRHTAAFYFNFLMPELDFQVGVLEAAARDAIRA